MLHGQQVGVGNRLRDGGQRLVDRAGKQVEQAVHIARVRSIGHHRQLAQHHWVIGRCGGCGGRRRGRGAAIRWGGTRPPVAHRPAFNHRHQVGRQHRLGDEVVHAGGQAGLPVFGEGIGRQRHHRHLAVALTGIAAAQAPRCLQPVHVGHLPVHQHQVERRLRQQLQCPLAIAGHGAGEAGVLQHRPHHGLVDRVVLGHQHPAGALPGHWQRRRGGRLRRPTGDTGPQPADQRAAQHRACHRPGQARHTAGVGMRRIDRAIDRQHLAGVDPRQGTGQQQAPRLGVRRHDEPGRPAPCIGHLHEGAQRGQVMAALRLAAHALQQCRQRQGAGLVRLAPGHPQPHRPGLVACLAGQRQRQVQREARAHAGNRLGHHVATHQPGQVTADRQAQAAAAEAAGGRRIGLLEGLEDGGQRLRRHADAGVADLDLQPVGRGTGRAHIDRHIALRGELHRIAQQVEQQLAQAHLVAVAPQRHGGVDLAAQAQALGAGQRPRRLDGRLQAIHQVEVMRLQHQGAGLDARQVEHMLDQAQQVAAAGADDVHQLGPPCRIGTLGLQQLGRADHAVERAAQFMAHVGQEAGLGL